MLKIVAVASADENAAQILMHDLLTLNEKNDGSAEQNALRWQRRVNRAVDKARYDTPKVETSGGFARRSYRQRWPNAHVPSRSPHVGGTFLAPELFAPENSWGQPCRTI